MTFNTAWVPVYNAFVLTCLLITQIYLATAIVVAQARQARERREAAAKQLAEARANQQPEPCVQDKGIE